MKALCHSLVEDDLVHAKPNSAGARFFYESGSTGVIRCAQSGFAIILRRVCLIIGHAQEEIEEIALKRHFFYSSVSWMIVHCGLVVEWKDFLMLRAQARERLHPSAKWKCSMHV